MLFIVCVTVHFDLKKTFARDQACLMSCFIFSCQEYNVKKQSIQTSNSALMYRSNRSFNMPPPGNPPSIWLFWKLLFKFPHYPGQNAVQMPHTGVHSGDQMPPPRGHFTGTKMTEGWRAYACKIYATVEIHLKTVFTLPGHCARVRYSLGTNVNTPMTACSHNSGTVQVRVRGRDLVLGHDSGTESLCAHRTFLFGSGLIHCFVLSATLTFQNGVCQGEIE